MNGSTIILNRMYVGRYLDENIGHEIINLVKDDNGDNYIYVNPHGTINPKYDNTIKAIILVKHIEKGVLEVIAKAESLEQIAYQSKHSEKQAVVEENQLNYIKENGIKYGGAFLHEIYGTGATTSGTFITFKSNKLRKPKRPMYLINEREKLKEYEHCCLMTEKHFSNQSLKMYYRRSEELKDYALLCDMLANSKLWEKVNTTEKLNSNSRSSFMMRDNFISIIRQEYNELTFSNLFAYFFRHDPDMFCHFAKQVLGIHNFHNEFNVIRESYDNIDLWIEDSDSVIIIENKIKSKINGERHDIYSKKIQSQLSKYYRYAKQERHNKNIYCYIFSPDYNNVDLSKYEAGNHYTLINYSKIYEFYRKHAGDMIHAKYFSEFLDALHMHTQAVGDRNFEEMRDRFLSRIQKLTDITWE